MQGKKRTLVLEPANARTVARQSPSMMCQAHNLVRAISPSGHPHISLILNLECGRTLTKPLESGVGGVNSLLCVSACWEGCGLLEGLGKCSPFSGPAVPLLSLTVYGDIMVCSLKGQP